MPSACILADSLAPTGERLVTATVRMPLIVWQELLTHRTMSRGSGSSRAVPLLKRKAEALADPFIPDAFPINGPGMSPARYTVPGTDEHAAAVAWWLRARDHAVDSARDSITLSGVDDHGDLRLDVHKEIANRLLHPFLETDGILSATEWSNFYTLRLAGVRVAVVQDPRWLGWSGRRRLVMSGSTAEPCALGAVLVRGSGNFTSNPGAIICGRLSTRSTSRARAISVPRGSM